jgi:Ca2+-dependent lipid-binding protein
MAQLQVTVIEGRNLKKKDFLSENDPFVQLYLDNENQKQKTKVKHNSKNPKWNQIFVLYVFLFYFFFHRNKYFDLF